MSARMVSRGLLRAGVALIALSGPSDCARIKSRSILLRSCRRLPGQSCACRIASASSPILRGRMPA